MTFTFVNGAIFAVFSPLGSMFIKVYKAEVLIFNINSLSICLLYFPANFLIANYTFKHWGVHLSLLLGVGLECISLGCRALINESFTIAMAGGFFLGLAQPMLMNANTETATNWFATAERPVAVAMGVIMGPLGSGFGYVMHLFFVSSEDYNDDNIAKEHIFKLCWVSGLIFAGAYVIALLVYREKPPIPPTKSACTVSTEPVIVSLKSLWRNSNFWLITCAFSGTYGCLTTFSQEVALMVGPFGFDSVIF